MEEMNATIAVTKPVVKTVKLENGKDFKIKLWDCGGQERFKNISKAFLKDAVGCIIVFSLDSTKSLKAAKSWIDSVNSMRAEGKHIQIVLVANKADLPADQIEFTDWESEGKKLAQESSDPKYGEVPFFDTSAKTGKNVEAVFLNMATMIDSASKKSAPATSTSGDSPKPSEGGGCCIVS